MSKNLLNRLFSIVIGLCLLLTLVFPVLSRVAAAAEEGHGSLFKPSVSQEVLYWGTNKVSAKNQTVKFSGYLIAPSNWYGKSTFWVGLRSKTLGNPWDGPDTGYFIFLDGEAVTVKYCNLVIYKTTDDTYASEAGFEETRTAMKDLLAAAGSAKNFYTAIHDYEFSVVDEEGGVRLTAKIDGTVVLNWLDTNRTVTDAGGFRVSAEDIYEWYSYKLSFTGDDGVEMHMLSEEHIDKLMTNSLNHGGYVSTEPLELPEPLPTEPPTEPTLPSDYTPDGEFDLSQCEKLDFSELVADTYDWTGQIRNHPGRTVFYPNGIEYLQSEDKSGGFTRKGASYENFYLDLTIKAEVCDEFIERNKKEWVYIFTFRDSNQTWNNWDLVNKNAYAILLEYHPGTQEGAIALRRWNNTTGSLETTNIERVEGLTGMVGQESTWRIASYTTDAGVRIGIWLNGEQIVDVLDRDEKAVRTGGSFMIGQHGTVQDTIIPIVKSIRFLGLEKGPDRPVYSIGIDEPVPEGSAMYPLDTYQKPDVNAPGDNVDANSPDLTVIIAAAVVVVLVTVAVIVVVKKNGGKKK